MKKVNYILAVLILLTFLVISPADVVKGANGVEVPLGCGVVFDQVDFTFPGLSVPLPDSDWGRVTVYPDVLAECTGMSSGYLNVFTTDVGWVVANLAIDLADGTAPVTTYFTLFYNGYPNDVTTLFASVWFHPDPLEVVMVNASNEFPVGAWEWNAQGAGDEDVTSIGPPPPPVVVLGSPPDESHVLPNPVNVQTAKNQCFPMSVANSLQFLEETYNLMVPHNHVMGLDGDNTLVGQLDDLANRNVTNSCNGSGVWFVPMLEGKFDYLDANGLKDELIHKHQGQGYGTPGTEALNDGDFQHKGIVSREEGNTVTWEWISKQIQNGEDVELVYKHATGGHAVRVFGCGITEGEKWVRYLHDATQAYGDPANPQGDNVGLEIVQQNVSDLDNDGTLNLGSASREIMFALSESTKHCTDTPDYDQEKIAQVPIPWQFWATELEENGGPTTYNIIDRIRISPTWLEPPQGQPAGEGPIFVQRQFAVLEPWMGDKIPLEELVWDFANDAPGPDIPGPPGWVAVSGDPVEVAAGEDLVLEIPIQPALDPSSAVLVAYEVITGSEDGPVVGHFINEAVTWWGGAPGYEPTIVEVLVNFDIHNNTGRPVTNFELDFEGLYFGCEDVVEAIGFVAAQGMPPVPVPPETWGANADNPLVVRPIDGGTEVKWIQRDRPLEHCEWLHVGLVFKIPGFIDNVNATVQGYWTVIPEAPPPPPPPTPPSEVPVGITVMPMDKAELVIPWIVLIGAMLLIVGVSLLIRRRAIR